MAKWKASGACFRLHASDGLTEAALLQAHCGTGLGGPALIRVSIVLHPGRELFGPNGYRSRATASADGSLVETPNTAVLELVSQLTGRSALGETPGRLVGFSFASPVR